MGAASSHAAVVTGESPEEGLMIMRRRLEKLERASASARTAKVAEKANGIVAVLKRWPVPALPPNEAYRTLVRALDKLSECSDVDLAVAAECSVSLIAPAARGYGGSSTQLADSHVVIAVLHMAIESWGAVVAHCQAAYPILSTTRGERWLDPSAGLTELPPRVTPTFVQPLARLPVGPPLLAGDPQPPPQTAPPPLVQSPPLPSAPEGSEEDPHVIGSSMVPGCMDVLRLLVHAHVGLGQKDLALAAALRHLQILESMYGRFHIGTLPGVRSYFIASLHDAKSGDVRGAVETAKCVIALTEKAYGQNNVKVVDSFEDLAWMYLVPGDAFSCGKASSLAQRARIIRTLSGADMAPNDELLANVKEMEVALAEGLIDDKGRTKEEEAAAATDGDATPEEAEPAPSSSGFYETFGGVPSTQKLEAIEGIGDFVGGVVSDTLSFLKSVTDQL
jgi:hypothetical protein